MAWSSRFGTCGTCNAGKLHEAIHPGASYQAGITIVQSIAFRKRPPSVGAGSFAAAPGQSGAMMIAIKQAPEWLRPLHLILPASRLRPIDKMVRGGSKRKDEVDSPDDENGGNRGGYGS
jgi:hypothetical protein